MAYRKIKSAPPKNAKGHQKLKPILVSVTTLVVALVVSVWGFSSYHQHQINQVSQTIQTSGLKQRPAVASAATIKANHFAYGGQNHGIPNAKQLKAYQTAPGKVYGRGYIAVPTQKGVTQAIPSMVINEGASDKVLAIGAGTPRQNEVMGQGNFSVAAHNFGNNKTYFSPMQRRIDVNQTPKVYLTDGQKIYTYQFNKTTDQVAGRQVVNAQHGEVMDDAAGKGETLLTMITCDEPGLMNLHPSNRLLLRAHLVHTEAFNQAAATEKSLFPQLQ